VNCDKSVLELWRSNLIFLMSYSTIHCFLSTVIHPGCEHMFILAIQTWKKHGKHGTMENNIHFVSKHSIWSHLIIILIALCILFTPCDAILFLNSLVPDGKNNSKVGCQWGAKARPARIEHVDLSIGINYQQLGFVGISWEYNFHITWWCTVSIQPNWYDIWYLMVSLKIDYLNFDGVSPCFSR
jgi:hypothetical protein